MYVQIASTNIYMATQSCIQVEQALKTKSTYYIESKIFENVFVAVEH